MQQPLIEIESSGNLLTRIVRSWAVPAVSVYPDQPVVAPGETIRTQEILKAALIVYYTSRLSEHAAEEQIVHQNVEIITEDQRTLFQGCLTHLNGQQPVAIVEFNKGHMVHTYRNSLMLVPENHNLNATQLQSTDTQGNILFNACSLWSGLKFHPSTDTACLDIFGVDNNGGIHEWIYTFENDAANREYVRWPNTIPGSITAIRQLAGHATAFFYRDDGNSARVALAFTRWRVQNQIERKLIMSDIKDVTHVTAKEGWLGHERFVVHPAKLLRYYVADVSIVRDGEDLGEEQCSCSIQ